MAPGKAILDYLVATIQSMKISGFSFLRASVLQDFEIPIYERYWIDVEGLMAFFSLRLLQMITRSFILDPYILSNLRDILINFEQLAFKKDEP